MVKEKTFFVSGMHCSSCEVLIEKKLLELKDIKSVEAKTSKGEVIVELAGNPPTIEKINQLFEKEGYVFSEKPLVSQKTNDFGFVAGAAGLSILVFLLLSRLGLNSLIKVTSQSSLPMFFLFGLLAGVSSCAALIGGMVLSLAKKWGSSSHLLFNLGRIIAFFILGGLLGWLGQLGGVGSSAIPPAITSLLVIGISALMVLMSLQMVGIKFFQRFQFTLPRFITRFIADDSNFQGRFMPGLMGVLTFFLPCGFTLSAQGLALLSGNPAQGALIMAAFVLGTTPMLLGIGLSSLKLSRSPHWANRFTKVAGILVLFFALFNLNSQLNVLGLTSFTDLALKNKAVDSSIGNAQQVIRMAASASGYEPNYFQVQAGVPVRWEITDTGTSGCTNAIIARGLFAGQIPLTHGQTSIKEFTPEKPGKYKFSCWMGMVSGVIEVIDKYDKY